MPNRIFNTMVCPMVSALLLGISSFAQTTAPFAVNIAGTTTSVGNFSLEWSVGESAAITTMGNSNLLVTNGLLQFNVENQTEANLVKKGAFKILKVN
jgi:hypothetical protein